MTSDPRLVRLAASLSDPAQAAALLDELDRLDPLRNPELPPADEIASEIRAMASELELSSWSSMLHVLALLPRVGPEMTDEDFVQALRILGSTDWDPTLHSLRRIREILPEIARLLHELDDPDSDRSHILRIRRLRDRVEEELGAPGWRVSLTEE